jgi:activator of HSP90 ATPase
LEKFKITLKVKCAAKDLCMGWMDNKVHGEFTGGAVANISPSEGGKFSVSDGYITGTNVEIFPPKKIMQKWRTTDFDETDEDSLLELIFTKKEDYTLLSLNHTNLPDGSGDKYKKGWKENYFVNIKKYFEK